MFKKLLGLALLLFSFSTASAQTYPFKISSNGRYLTDANNVPTILVGDTAHDLIGHLTPSDISTYMADRKKDHFNAVNIYAPCGSYVACNSDGSAQDGTRPFTSGSSPANYDLSTPNNAYFTKIDNAITVAAANGITIMFDPMETGDFLTTLEANGTLKAFNYGVFLGNRYKTFPNIIWMQGEDFQTWNTNSNDNALVAQVMAGIASVDSNHIQTIELNYRISYSNQDSSVRPYLGADYLYTYDETYADALAAYNSTPAVPVILGEANYENENDTGSLPSVAGAEVVRRQVYWTLLSGGVGHFYGNGNVNHFDTGWQNSLDTAAVNDLNFATTLFSPYQWWSLVPDQSHVIVTSGFGTFNASNENLTTGNYVTASATPDGTLAFAYAPTTATLAVNMAKFVNQVIARWYDPSNGTFQVIGTFSNSGSHNFVTPGNDSDGNKDWVLVLDATVQSAPLPVTITTTSLPNGVVNSPYSQTVSISGGTAPFNWVITGLPAGLTNSGPVISGTPSVTGTLSVSVTVTDSALPTTSATAVYQLVINSQPTFTPVRIKAGPAYTDSQGNVWGTDTPCSGGSVITRSHTIANALPGASDSALYLTERYGNSKCVISTPAGTYTVTFKFSEDYFNASGSRKFNVLINGAQVLTSFDIFAVTGAQWKATDQSFTFSTPGATTFTFTTVLDNAIYDAIQVVQSGPPPPPPPVQTENTSCTWITTSNPLDTWQCNTVTTNIPSGQAIKSIVTTGALTNTVNGAKP